MATVTPPQVPTRAPSANEWRELFADFYGRLHPPLQSPTFVLYFIFVMLLIGGLGIWIPVFQSVAPQPSGGPSTSSNISTSSQLRAYGIASTIPSQIASYLMAVIAAAFVDVMLDRDSRRSFRMSAFALLTIAILLGSVALGSAAGSCAAWVSAIAGAVCSLFLWWIANARNVNLHQGEPSLNATTGGDTATPLAGNLDGLTS